MGSAILLLGGSKSQPALPGRERAISWGGGRGLRRRRGNAKLLAHPAKRGQSARARVSGKLGARPGAPLGQQKLGEPGLRGGACSSPGPQLAGQASRRGACRERPASSRRGGSGQGCPKAASAQSALGAALSPRRSAESLPGPQTGGRAGLGEQRKPTHTCFQRREQWVRLRVCRPALRGCRGNGRQAAAPGSRRGPCCALHDASGVGWSINNPIGLYIEFAAYTHISSHYFLEEN